MKNMLLKKKNSSLAFEKSFTYAVYLLAVNMLFLKYNTKKSQ